MSSFKKRQSQTQTHIPKTDAIIEFENDTFIFYHRSTGIEIEADYGTAKALVEGGAWIDNGNKWVLSEEQVINIEFRRGKIVRIFTPKNRPVVK